MLQLNFTPGRRELSSVNIGPYFRCVMNSESRVYLSLFIFLLGDLELLCAVVFAFCGFVDSGFDPSPDLLVISSLFRRLDRRGNLTFAFGSYLSFSFSPPLVEVLF